MNASATAHQDVGAGGPPYQLLSAELPVSLSPWKTIISRLVARAGYTVLPTWRLKTIPLAICLRELFALKRVSLVIDVGANNGQYRDFLRHYVGYAGPIVSFEPVPELASSLQEKAATDRYWTVRRCALGAEPGELTMNITAKTVFSSFFRPLSSASFGGENVVTRTEAVRVSTLDAEFPDSSALVAAYLKLDTQGFDLEVLKGGRAAAKFIPALQSEVSFLPIYNGMPEYMEALRTFGQFGFSVSDMFIVNKDDTGAAIEFDCVMVRNGAVTSGF